MATNQRHAAWHHERSYAVKAAPADGEPIELAAGLSDFLEAVDLANEWLEREDPARSGAAEVAIHELRGDDSSEVWRYPARDRPAHDRPLVDTFGFDPVGWVPAVKEFSARPAPAPAPPQRVEPVALVVPEAEPTAPASGRELRDPRPFLRSAWDDTVSRVCLIVGGLALWLTLTLVDARFLALLLLALTGLWWRREHRAAASERAGLDDDLL